jgi:hypothetical protein
VDEAHTNDDDEDGGGRTTVTTGHQTRIRETYRQERSASVLDTLCCESNYYQLLTGEDDKADNDNVKRLLVLERDSEVSL